MASGEALFNPYLPEFHADPYPFYRRLRAVAPVYDDVLTVLRDPRFGRDGFEQMLAAVYAADLASIVDAARAQGAAGDVLAAARSRWRRSSPTRSRRSCAARTSPISPR